MELSLLKEQYEQLSHTGTAFCEYFERECKCLLDDANIAYYELSFRIKTWDSIVQKIERKNLSPTSIQEIHDVIGFRIITLFKRDVDTICEIINRECNVLYFDDKAAEKEADVFGYLSVHYEISLKDHWMGAPTTAKFRGVHAEIQVRTFSQHVWAAASHLLQYKNEETVPLVMRRDIYRLAAVLEMVDNELENIRSSRDSILDQRFPPANIKSAEVQDAVLPEAFAYGIRWTARKTAFRSGRLHKGKRTSAHHRAWVAALERYRFAENCPYIYTEKIHFDRSKLYKR